MLQIVIAAMLALGIISSPQDATTKKADQHQVEIQQYIIGTDMDQI